MPRYTDTPTIAEEERYSDWKAQVAELLTARGLDIQAAYDNYSFHMAYYDFDDMPEAAVDDYAAWYLDNAEECAA